MLYTIFLSHNISHYFTDLPYPMLLHPFVCEKAKKKKNKKGYRKTTSIILFVFLKYKMLFFHLDEILT